MAEKKKTDNKVTTTSLNGPTRLDEFLPLRDAVFQALRGEILTGRLKPGERLLEIELSQRLGVSRTPVREAIHKLELEGLVSSMARRGARVAQINEKGLRDVMEVRHALETLAIKMACTRIEPDELQTLSACMEEVEQAVQHQKPDIIAEADVRFHNTIIEAAHNDRLSAIISNLQEQMYRYRFEYIKDPENYRDILEEHREMFQSINDKDIDRGIAAIDRHIRNQLASIIARISTEGEKNEQ